MNVSLRIHPSLPTGGRTIRTISTGEVMASNLHGSLLSRVSFPWLLAGLCLSAAGCGKVVKPTSDSTPPTLVWNVLNLDTNVQADHPGSPTINAKRGERYRVILKANDTGGVKSIKINPTVGGGEMSWGCKTSAGGENLGQNKDALLGPMSQDLAPDSDGKVLTSIFLIYELDFAMECQAGWSFTSGTAKLTGQASNYFGGVTTEVITFKISP
jgi:hypothetical protein